MTVYFLLFSILLIFVIGELSGMKIGMFFKVLLVLFIIGISGFRFEIGNDYNNYVAMFNNKEWLIRIEPGFMFLISVIKYLGLGHQTVFLISSIISIVPVAYIIHRYSPHFFFTGVSAYVFSYIYFEGMNTVRQAIAMAIMFFCFCDYLSNKKLRNFILMTVLAAMFHFSVLLVAAIGWLIIKVLCKKDFTILFALLLLVSYILGFYIQEFTAQITDVAVLIGKGDSKYLDQIEQRGVDSGSFLYILNLYAISFILFLRFKRKCLSDFEKGIIKLFVTAVVVYNLFVGFYIGLRFYWYFFLFITLTIPSILCHVKRSGRVFIYLMIICLFVAYTIVSLDSPYYSPYNCTFELIK